LEEVNALYVKEGLLAFWFRGPALSFVPAGLFEIAGFKSQEPSIRK
jgi:hypothetical protein